MKRKSAEYPYDDYWLYIVYHKKENRRYANLIPKDKSTRKRQTISYARYLMSVKEKRILAKTEHVDHKDDDKTNDDINNLQIVTLHENNIKEAVRRGGHAMVELSCPVCKTTFVRTRNRTQLLQPKKCTCCSRHCAGILAHKLMKTPDDPILADAISKNIIREFRSIEIQ